ncbi:MAG: helix-turn-helix domain-containing protein, partial [Myxococcales bacterium]|nr:helix-turn-helix domain-containing protein [Myxococcales bacterium]
MQSTPKPVDRAEAVALFRAMLLGDVLASDLGRGELATRLRALSEQRFRPPGSDTTRRYGVSTLERWYYAYCADGLAGLRPAPRSDRGHAKALTPAQQQLVLDTAEAHPDASAALILRTQTCPVPVGLTWQASRTCG